MRALATKPLLSLILTTLSIGDKILFGILVLARAVLVALDIAGLLALGAATASLTGTPSSGLPVNWFGNSVATGVNDKILLVAATLGLFMLKGLGSIALNLTTASFVARIEAHKATEYLEKFLKQGLEVEERYSKNHLSHALTTATANAIGSTLVAISIISSELALILGISILLIAIDMMAFAAVAVLMGTISLCLNLIVGRSISRYAEKADDAQLSTGEILMDVQNNFRQIKAMKSETGFTKAFKHSRKQLAEATNRLLFLHSVPRYIIELGLVLVIGVFTLPEVLGLRLGMTAPELAIFVMGLLRLMASTLPLQNQLNVVKQNAQEARLPLEFEALSNSNPNSIPTEEFDEPHIFIENLGFRYPNSERHVFKDLSLHVPFGSLVAIVGPSGSGKSTFADLILGFRESQEGTIRVRSRKHSITEIDSRDFLIAYVPQRTWLFSGTLAQNIALDPFLDNTSSFDKISRAIRSADLEEFISKMPRGLETIIRRDSNFSGGQVQRLGLARAFYSNSKVMVIDEGTSALDAKSAAEIQKTIQALRGSRTIFLITHQEKIIKDADILIRFTMSNLVQVKSK